MRGCIPSQRISVHCVIKIRAKQGGQGSSHFRSRVLNGIAKKLFSRGVMLLSWIFGGRFELFCMKMNEDCVSGEFKGFYLDLFVVLVLGANKIRLSCPGDKSVNS